MNEKYWVALSSIEEISSQFIIKLFNEFGGIRQVFEAEGLAYSNIEGITKNKFDKFLKLRDSVDIDKVYDYVLERDIKVITFENPNYPKMLKNIDNPPAVLYYRGDLSVCNLEKTLAVIGSRRLSRNGKDSLRKIMKDFYNTDMCIVSGLATGADTSAHEFALENNLKTIGVIGSGLNHVYPAQNKDLYKNIINGNGVVMSEYYPTFEPLPFRFPQRNRIVSGLSYGTLVVEAALKSGALITANLTLEQGRELMCIPGLITNPNTEGVYKLLKTGATIVTNGDDVLETMGWEKILQQNLFNQTGSSVTEGEENNKNNEITIDEKKILYTIELEPKSFDEIQALTKISTEELLMALTKLELDGKIELNLGDRYIKR